MYTFVDNKLFDQLLNISHKNFTVLKTFDQEFSYIEVSFTDQNSHSLERTTRKITSQEGGFFNFLRPLMTAGLPLLKSRPTSLAKRGLRATNTKRRNGS